MEKSIFLSLLYLIKLLLGIKLTGTDFLFNFVA